MKYDSVNMYVLGWICSLD